MGINPKFFVCSPGEDNVPESSNDQPEPEESAVTEEVPVEKEVAEDEG